RVQRADLCRRLTARLGLDDRVEVVAADAHDLARRGSFDPVDAVVARGFGPPEATAAAAVPLLASGGVLVVSEPPDGQRWTDDLLRRFALQHLEEVRSPARAVSLRRVGDPAG